MDEFHLDQLSLNTLIKDLKDGRFVIPNFQRGVEWDENDVRQLMRSIFNDFFIGSLFLWSMNRASLNKEWQDLLECEPISGYRESQVQPRGGSGGAGQNQNSAKIVLDGQQRLPAMYYAFFGHGNPSSSNSRLSREWFFIDIERFERGYEENKQFPDSAFISRQEVPRDSTWFSALNESNSVSTKGKFFPYEEWQGHRFPLRLLGAGEEAVWLIRYEDYWSQQATNHENQANHHKAESVKRFDLASKSNNNFIREEYKPDDSSYQTLKQKAEEADSKVSACQRELEDLRARSRSLRKEERQSSNTAHLRENVGKKIADNKWLSATKRGELNNLQAEARKAHQDKEKAREELDSRASESNSSQRSRSDTLRAKSVSELLTEAVEEERKHADHAERAKEAKQSIQFGRAFRDRIAHNLLDFIVPAFILEEELAETTVSDMFSQLNRRGRELKLYDFLNAHVSLRRVPLKKLTREFEDHLDSQGLLWDRAREDVMRIMLIDVHPHADFALSEDNCEILFPGRSFDTGSGNIDMPVKDVDHFQERWTRAQQIYEEGLDTLRTESSYGQALTKTQSPSNFVPFYGILPVYCSLLAQASDADAWEDQVQQVQQVQQWYWASALTRRYMSTQDSSNAERGKLDYHQMQAWLANDTGNIDKPIAIRDFEGRFGMSLFPRDGLYPGLTKAVRSMFFRLHPISWSTEKIYLPEGIGEEYIVSEQWCVDQNIPTVLAKSVFNEVLTDPMLSEAMNGRSLQQYIKEDLGGSKPNQAILNSHCISSTGFNLLMKDSFSRDDFEKFLREREAEFLRRLAQDDLFRGLNLIAPQRDA